MTSIPPPSAEAQLVFLTKLQRLFTEGDFTATYKFALLIALADLAVELGSDDGGELRLTTRMIGERFVQQYWRHASPYGIGHPETTPGVLIQNLGSQAAVINTIASFMARTGASTQQQATKHPTYAALVTQVTQTVSAQPLNYLQNFGGATDPFLYERNGSRTVILKAGVAYCLRRFHPLVQQLARTHWVGHVKSNKRNYSILGNADDLEAFLFQSSRQSLFLLGQELRKIDGGRCFYCGEGLSAIDVDHYIPFALYPRDLAHNFVLAHPSCNRSKSDMLAARSHLERWLDRITKRADDLSGIGESVGISVDGSTSWRVAAWSYANAQASGARAWVSPSNFEVVDTAYVSLFEIKK